MHILAILKSPDERDDDWEMMDREIADSHCPDIRFSVRRCRRPIVLLALLLAAFVPCGTTPCAAQSEMELAPPATRVSPTTDQYHDTEVQDNYRWLEDWSRPEVKQWSQAQNAYTRKMLDALPSVPEIRERVTEIMSAKNVSYGSVRKAGPWFYAMKTQPPKEQAFLVAFRSLDAPEQTRVLFDPNLTDAEGTTSIDWFEPSHDGSRIAISISTGGSEVGDVRVLETASGQPVGEVVPRVNSGTAGGDLAWDPDGEGFYYTRHPRPGERDKADLNFFQQLYFHAIGTDSKDDRFELGEGFPRIAEIEVEVHPQTGQVLCNVQNGDGGEFSHYLRRVTGEWIQFSRFGDKLVQATFSPEGDVLAITRQNAPKGKIVRLNIQNGDAVPVEVVPESADTIVTSFYHAPPSLLATNERLYVTYQLGGPSEIRVFDQQGNRQDGPEQLPISTVGGFERLGGDDLLFRNHSYISPTQWKIFRAETGTTENTGLSSRSPVNLDDVVVTRKFATSKDGTRIPINIQRPASAKSPGPLILYGYGGYSINLTPKFSASRKALLEQGVTYVVANLRGGGEYGEAWHKDGNLTKKQNVFDDFYAAAQFLIDEGYTTSDQLAILGGSNGGLLMGATMTQHPGLARCVVSHVGIYDMLRVELSPNGSFNIPEFGTVKDPDQFRALYAYSPIHRVRDAVEYPATLFFTGENDPRVDPMQSRKMTARLQAATSAKAPILLRTSANAGHGGDSGLSQRIEEAVDAYAFLFHHLGVRYSEVER